MYVNKAMRAPISAIETSIRYGSAADVQLCSSMESMQTNLISSRIIGTVHGERVHAVGIGI